MHYLAQTDVTVRSLVDGPAGLTVLTFLVIGVCGFALVRSFFEQLARPIPERQARTLLLPFIMLLLAMVVELGALFMIVGLSFNFTFVVSLPLTILTGYLIWVQFLGRAMAELPSPKSKQP